jgi:hypothetical protein
MLKGDLKLDDRGEIVVAVLSRGEAPPSGECTLYLEHYSPTITDRWRLVDDDPLKKQTC